MAFSIAATGTPARGGSLDIIPCSFWEAGAPAISTVSLQSYRV
jgi:hypothetical protein